MSSAHVLLLSHRKGSWTMAYGLWPMVVSCPLVRPPLSQTLRTMYPYTPQNEDELELVPGDFIFMSPVEQSSASEGWVYGTSLGTGLSGLLPENYVSRADECDTWIFHGCVQKHGKLVNCILKCKEAECRYCKW